MNDPPRITYVVSCYFGSRPRAGFAHDSLRERLDSLTRHLDRLDALDVPAVREVLFVANLDDPVVDAPLLEQASASAFVHSSRPAHLLCRENRGYSYGAWHEGVRQLMMGDSTHAFLIEDDYLPAMDRFYQPFLDEMNPRVSFVCQAYAHFPGTNPPNADVANGLLSLSAARQVASLFGGDVFSICDLPMTADDYALGCENQVTFLALLLAAGYSVSDVTQTCSVPFHWFGDSIVERGVHGAPTPVAPSDAVPPAAP